MLKEKKTTRRSDTTDDVTLVFECTGNRSNNYNEMLDDCVEAVVQLTADYESGTMAGHSPHEDLMRQKLTGILDSVYAGWHDKASMIMSAILEHKEVLPVLIGIDPDLDQAIAQKLKS